MSSKPGLNVLLLCCQQVIHILKVKLKDLVSVFLIRRFVYALLRPKPGIQIFTSSYFQSVLLLARNSLNK